MALKAGYVGIKKYIRDKLNTTYMSLLSTVNILNDTQGLTVTAPEGITVNANTQVKKSGRVVTGCIRLEFSEVPAAGSTICTIPVAPFSSTYNIAVENAGGKTMPVIVERATGNVKLFGAYQPTSGNQLIIAISYVAADLATRDANEGNREVIPEISQDPEPVTKITKSSTKKTATIKEGE